MEKKNSNTLKQISSMLNDTLARIGQLNSMTNQNSKNIRIICLILILKLISQELITIDKNNTETNFDKNNINNLFNISNNEVSVLSTDLYSNKLNN